jgi:hypothetical protein
VGLFPLLAFTGALLILMALLFGCTSFEEKYCSDHCPTNAIYTSQDLRCGSMLPLISSTDQNFCDARQIETSALTQERNDCIFKCLKKGDLNVV